MGRQLDGQVAIVTGASSGIGRAVAEALSAQGVRLTLVARSEDRLRAVAAELPSDTEVVAADVADATSGLEVVNTTLQRFGQLDIAIANAGVYLPGPFWESELSEIDRLVRTNVLGVVNLCHATLRHMVPEGCGDVIVTSSVSGHQAIHWEPVYSASKHAVQAFVHTVRRQLTDTGVRLGSMAPGRVLNELWGDLDPEQVRVEIDAGQGMRSEDVADAITFMLTRPHHLTVRDLVLLPRAQEL
jgi:ribitol 2-dehydrogenase